MSLFSCPRLSLLLLALATLPPSIIAEPLPSSIVIFHPADGSIANSSADEASQYGLIGGSPGDYLQKVEFSLTYPNGTVSGGGGVSSGGCLSRGGTYTFGFNNSQAGEYMLEALVSVAVEVDGVCPGPEDHQNSTVSVKWSSVEPNPDGSSSSGTTPTPVTETASLAEAPTGTYTPEKPVNGASRQAVGALAALFVGASAMGLLA